MSDDKPVHKKSTWRLSRNVILGCVALAIAWVGISSWLVGPPIPKTLNLATGSSSGVYYQVGLKYRDLLLPHGIELNVLQTDGSVENLQLLNQGDATLAIVQGGVGSSEQRDELSSLASLYLEPVWICYRKELELPRDLADFRGRRIAVGTRGSGTFAIAAEWLTANGFSIPDDSARSHAPDDKTTFQMLGSAASVAALEAREVDVAFFVMGANADIVSQLVANPDLRFMNVSRGQAYAKRYPYLKPVTFAEGMLDLQNNLPREDVSLMATTANLVASAELHPALIQLLLQAAQEVHGDGGFFEAPNEFPSPLGVDIPINADAKRYFANGPSLLYRYLPFRWANWLDRMKLLLAPMIMLLIPLVKAFPPIYRLRIRRRIYKWYRVLRETDQKLKLEKASERVNFSDDIRRLKKMETELAEVSVPLSYMQEFYNLRLHVNYVLGLLRQRCEQFDSPNAFDEFNELRAPANSTNEAFAPPTVK